MKKLILLFCLVVGLLRAQSEKLVFNKNFVEAENNWVAIEGKNGEYFFAFLYFDESGGGYSMQYFGTFKMEDGKFVKTSENNTESSISIYRLPHSEIAFAILPEEAVSEMKLKIIDGFLEGYNGLKDENLKTLKRASAMNGLRASKLALPYLEDLYKKGYFVEGLYFELAFSYNALGKFEQAEKLLDEARDKNIFNELIVKEYIFALVNGKKVMKAEEVLEKNLHLLENALFREESIYNLIMGMKHIENEKGLKKWLKIYDEAFQNRGRYIQKIEEIRKNLK